MKVIFSDKQTYLQIANQANNEEWLRVYLLKTL